ncbi:hypothetical protein FQA39_LY08061 [Lamprigera yunnana]|nr:hypothetical protein FQA39_LY08061 [Lamprigera yunnana]
MEDITLQPFVPFANRCLSPDDSDKSVVDPIYEPEDLNYIDSDDDAILDDNIIEEDVDNIIAEVLLIVNNLLLQAPQMTRTTACRYQKLKDKRSERGDTRQKEVVQNNRDE